MRYVNQFMMSFSVFALVSASQAGPLSLYMQQAIENNKTLVVAKTIKTEYFNQLLDHSNPTLGNFSQRYYVDESYSDNDESPVFFYLCGESACTERALMGAIRHYAKEHHAKLVALEHRYYGKSLPKTTFSTSDLSYLSTEMALDDLAYFQRRLKNDRQWTGKWVAFGGSYAGALSAWYRLKYPYLVVGALASSAPVLAKSNFVEYDAHVTSVLPETCLTKVRDVVSKVELSLRNDKELNNIKKAFDASEIKDNIDFLYVIADVAATAVQYGMQNEFCNALNSKDEPLQGYATFAKSLFQRYGITAVQLTAQGAMSENPADYKDTVGIRQWYYQSCTEFGYWQNANLDREKSMRSSLINPDYHQTVCQRLFDITEPANTNRINATFYYPLMSAMVSQIYFTNGENDPWSTLSLAERNGNANNSGLSYDLIKGASHCDDLRSPGSDDSLALKAVRQRMNTLLKEWLD
jgi:pimeloyl-ACP methyl ester carboxylesterase